MSDGHHCQRWFERNLRCPFDGEVWHELSYDPDDFDWDEYLDYSGLTVPSIAFTNMGYMVYGSILLAQQKALKTKTTSGASLNVAPFTSTGGYLAMVEAAEIAVATRVASGNTPQGLGPTETSSTQRPGLSVGSAASVIIWATAVAAAFALTKSPPPGSGTAGLAMAARVMPPEVLAWIANLTNLGKTSPGIMSETLALATATVGWFYQTREMAPLPERYERNVYNQNAWADPGLG